MAGWILLYNIGIKGLYGVYYVASFFNVKAKKWIAGRKNWSAQLSNAIQSAKASGKQPIVWVHTSSLGEFEQAKPIIETLKQSNTPPFVAVSFFSPSGLEASKNYAFADYVFYLPLDSPGNAEKLINILEPDLVIWVKYEYWYHYLARLNRHGIRVLLVSALFRKDKVFFKWYGLLHRKMLHSFHQIFVQDDTSAKVLGSILTPDKITLAGDTRFDRVVAIQQNFNKIAAIEKWLEHKKGRILVAGSTWPKDDEVLKTVVSAIPELILIIAPHNVAATNIASLKSKFTTATLFSQIDNKEEASNTGVLIIDNIGMLSRLYYYADYSFIGGGFASTGIHNILEAAVYAKPVLFGPNHAEYAEGQELIDRGGAFSLPHATALIALLKNLLNNPQLTAQTGKLARQYVIEKAGATQRVVDYIYKNRLLTN
jgi:3-deoxy-D-manno-octulosonic-acid transferase